MTTNLVFLRQTTLFDWEEDPPNYFRFRHSLTEGLSLRGGIIPFPDDPQPWTASLQIQGEGCNKILGRGSGKTPAEAFRDMLWSLTPITLYLLRESPIPPLRKTML